VVDRNGVGPTAVWERALVVEVLGDYSAAMWLGVDREQARVAVLVDRRENSTARRLSGQTVDVAREVPKAEGRSIGVNSTTVPSEFTGVVVVASPEGPTWFWKATNRS